ncbi:hypothetical protein HHK36_027034 [Tetracentron sinense]|uniref:Uncharacterized protein n=1 Tax=Tetracentron sinense TaxID=13715 RepID=A0A835D2N6_TETSI|nr:hypothetical protein HHK36_027034 [Tetracentron sinense]
MMAGTADEKFFPLKALFLDWFGAFCQVALHLLSEREKDDLAQLVDTMVSYSITYKNMKLEPLPSTPRHEATLDASALSFEPPITDFINFKGYRSGYCGLSLAVKQVLVHEVEKQKILRESIGKSTHSNEGSKNENLVLSREESGRSLSAKTNSTAAYAENNMENAKDKLTPRQWKADVSTNSSTSVSERSATASVKLKAPGDARKPSGGPVNFFDRFRKLSSKGSQNPDNMIQKPATLERDSRPLLFKYNEGFTNAVKRPVRIRDLLL